MSDPYAVTGTIWIACDACNATHEIAIDTPTSIDALTIPEPIGWELSPEGDRCPECVAAHRQVAHARTVTATITAP